MLLGFKRRFAPLVEDGSKTHTIRDREPPQVGETLHCYVDPRQKTMRLLGRWECVAVDVITIAWVRNGPRADPEIEVAISGLRLQADECNALAWRDGFRSNGRDGAFAEMMEYWKGDLPFKGWLIHWDYARPVHRRTKAVSGNALAAQPKGRLL
jgi:hypothetical protein